MKGNKIGVLFLVSALALAGIGTSYAMWYETITIDGTVNVGSLDFEWSIEDIEDTEIVGKDVSRLTADISENTMTVTITNAYPCITYSLWFDIHCVGNVPVHFDDFVFDPIAQTLIDLGILTFGPDPEYENQPAITDAQLHQDDEWYGLLTFHFTNIHPIQQDSTYTFQISLFGYQYNEPCDPPTNEKVVDLPDGPVGFKIWLTDYNGGDLYSCTSEITSIQPAGDYNIAVGNYLATWCADEEPTILVGRWYSEAQPYTAYIYSTYDPANPYPDDDWDKVNWIINHRTDAAYAGITGQGVQEAIWYFVNGGNEPTTPLGLQLRDDADANGEGFVPGPGEWCAVVVIVGGNVQTIFWEVDP